jgi:hypothetical protein
MFDQHSSFCMLIIIYLVPVTVGYKNEICTQSNIGSGEEVYFIPIRNFLLNIRRQFVQQDCHVSNLSLYTADVIVFDKNIQNLDAKMDLNRIH